MTTLVRACYAVDLEVPDGVDPDDFATEMGKTLFADREWFVDDVVDMNVRQHTKHTHHKVAEWLWRCDDTSRFCHEDETGFLLGDYRTVTEAQAALDTYAELLKGGSA